MSVEPVVPLVVLILLALVAGLLVWWPAGSREPADSLLTRSRRSAMVAFLLVAALRPGVPGGDVTVNATDLDVYFLIDTTSSVMAEDYAGGQPRLEGVRADVKGIAAQLPGARYTVMSFDHETVTRLPLTSDGSALASSVDTLQAETSTYSQGSSVTVARTALSNALDHGRQAYPERARVVFYLGDGEQTADSAPDPFDIDPSLINGGAVLGYGTTQGGRMKQTGTRREDFILDPSTGGPALSKIDEKELQAIAGQLKVPYLHRTADDGAASIVSQVALKNTASLASADPTRGPGGRTEFYWVFLLALALVAAWDLGVSVAAATALRAGRRRPGPSTSPSTAPASAAPSSAAPPPPARPEKVSTSTPEGRMTILARPQGASPPPPGPAGGPDGPIRTTPEKPEARAARLALRRTLIVWSLPFVLVLLLVAVKLLTMVAFGQQASAAYAAGDVTAVQQAGHRLSLLNLIERHKAPFALGDALVLTGDYEGARAYFEQALEVAPKDGLEACQVRVNLVLSLEKLGDAAKLASGLDAAKPFYDRVEVVVAAAPQGCFDPSGGTTGQELNDAKDRAQAKSKAPPDQPGDQGPQGQQPSPDKQQQLDDKTQQNQQQRAQGQGDQNSAGGSRPQVARPW